MTEEKLGYVDQNIIDSLRKEDPFGVRDFLIDNQITPAYSLETLKEIRRSNSEDSFLSVLESIGAKYIEPIFDNNQSNSQARVSDFNVFQLWKWFIEEYETTNEIYGLKGMLEKFYGGRKDESYTEIFEKGALEIKTTIEESLVDIDKDDAIPRDLKDSFRFLIENLENSYMTTGSILDSHETIPVKHFENVTGLGAKVLKNIEPPNVIEKIFEAVQDCSPGIELDMDIFFGIKRHPSELIQDTPKTLAEKINGIYQQLNFLGYYRDSKMKKASGFNRFSSDMTHAGIASFCHFLLCGDEGLVKKASAAYEYLNVDTHIIWFKRDKKST